jgi:hypothetical protein
LKGLAVITLDDIRRSATAFPEVEEFAHFRIRMRGFKVMGKPFAGMEKGETTAVFSISHEEAAEAVADDFATYEEVWRPGATKSFVASGSTWPRSRKSVSKNSSSTPGGTRPPNEWWPLMTPSKGL